MAVCLALHLVVPAQRLSFRVAVASTLTTAPTPTLNNPTGLLLNLSKVIEQALQMVARMPIKFEFSFLVVFLAYPGVTANSTILTFLFSRFRFSLLVYALFLLSYSVPSHLPSVRRSSARLAIYPWTFDGEKVHNID